MKIVRVPPSRAGCPKKHEGIRCTGIIMRCDLSRMEEGLGHEGFKCDTCGFKLKYVPPTGRVRELEKLLKI